MNLLFSFVLLFGISGGEIFVILLLVLILFGPKKIPEIARTIGKGINEIKKVQRDINTEIHRYSEEIEKPARQVTKEIDTYSQGLKNQVNGSVSDNPSETAPEKKDMSPGYSPVPDLPYPYAEADANGKAEPDFQTHPKQDAPVEESDSKSKGDQQS